MIGRRFAVADGGSVPRDEAVAATVRLVVAADLLSIRESKWPDAHAIKDTLVTEIDALNVRVQLAENTGEFDLEATIGRPRGTFRFLRRNLHKHPA